MGCDIGAVEIINTKLNTSLFLCRLSAEQLSPKSQPPPEMFCLPIFSARGSWWTGEAREEATEREEKGGQHIHVPRCARAHWHCSSRSSTVDPSAVCFEK